MKLTFCALIVGILTVGYLERNDEIKEHLQYCNDVEQGLQPDYKNSYDKICTDKIKAELKLELQ